MNVRRFHGFPSAIAVLAAIPAAQAGFIPGDPVWIDLQALEIPNGVAALDDDHIAVWDAPEGKGMALHHYQRDGGKGWRKSLGTPALADTAILVHGEPGGRVLVMHQPGFDLHRHALEVSPETGLALGPGKLVFGQHLQVETGTLGNLPVSAAGTADGGVILGYPGGVLLVVPEGKTGATAEWIIGEGPGAADDARQGWVVSVDGAGRVLALHQGTREVRYVDLASGKAGLLVPGKVWPRPDFLPQDAAAWGDVLFVSGTCGEEKEVRHTIMVLEPARGSWKAWDLGLDLSPGHAFTVTPAGHLVIVETDSRLAMILPNGSAPVKAEPDGKAVISAPETKGQQATQAGTVQSTKS